MSLDKYLRESQDYAMRVDLVDSIQYLKLLAMLTEAIDLLEDECGNRCAIGLNPCRFRQVLTRLNQMAEKE